MTARLTWAIFVKDLLDTLRDRRTLFMMIGVPVLLYPVIMLVSLQVAVMQHEHLERTVSRVVVDSPWLPLRAWLQEQPRLRVVESRAPDTELNTGAVDVVVRTPNFHQDALDKNKTVYVSLHYDATDFESMDAAMRVEDILNNAAKDMLTVRLQSAGIDDAYIQPLKIEQVNIAPPSKTTGSLLGLALPLLMVVMIALGAFYPAVDLTAGEKERGTFETLLSTPVSKLDIVLGKFLAVFILALVTGLLNLGSMAATVIMMFEQARPMFEENLEMEFSLPWQSAVVVVLVMLPLAGMISAIMMSIAVYARSFKDAQNYVTPFLLLLMVPAVLAALPGSELNSATACAPILNVVLLFRALMTGAATLALSMLVLGVTVLYAALALLLAAWLFHREDVVLADKSPPLFVRRIRVGLRSEPEPAGAFGLVFGIAVLFFYAGGAIQELGPLSGILVMQWGMILLPALAFLAVSKVDPYEALSLRAPAKGAWAGALLVGLGSLPLMLQLGYYNNLILPMPEPLEQAFRELFVDSEGRGQFALLFFAVAISPALCEEVLFRGVLLGSLRSRLHPFATILITGLLFGAFHLTVYRFFPQAIFGMLLTYLCWRGRSIYLAMFLHLLLNGTMLFLGTGMLPEQLIQRFALDQYEVSGVPLPVLVCALGLMMAGVSIIEGAARRSGRSLSPG